MTLHNEQDAISQACAQGGYKHYYPVDNTDHLAFILQDPAFWQALGKARGWPEHGDRPRERYIDNYTSLGHALRYFETKLSGGDTNQFWSTLP